MNAPHFSFGLGGNICSGERGTCRGTCECVCETNLTGIVDNPKLLRAGVSPWLAKRALLYSHLNIEISPVFLDNRCNARGGRYMG